MSEALSVRHGRHKKLYMDTAASARKRGAHWFDDGALLKSVDGHAHKGGERFPGGVCGRKEGAVGGALVYGAGE